MRYFLIPILLLLIVTSCNQGGYIALKDAERGMFLDRSRKVSTNTFFDRRMESELESQLSKDWYIVNEDLEYVYFGQLMKQNGFTMINPFYRVDRVKLDSLFPGYRSIEGKHIKAKVFQSFIKPVIEEHVMNKCPQSFNIQFSKRQYKLTKDGIAADVKLQGKCYEKRVMRADINVLLDPESLEVLEEKTSIK